MVLHGLVSRLIAKEFSFLLLWKKKEGVEVAWCGTATCVVWWGAREDRVSLLILLSLRSPSFCLAAIILASCVYSVLIFPITLLGYYE